MALESYNQYHYFKLQTTLFKDPILNTRHLQYRLAPGTL